MTMKFTRVRILGVFLLLAGTASSDDALELTWRNESAAPAAPRFDLPFRATRVHMRQADGSWRHVPYTNDAQGAAVLLTEVAGGAEAVVRVGMYDNADWQICPKSRTPPWPVQCPCCRTVAENAALRRHYEAVRALDAQADAVWEDVRTTNDVARLRERLRTGFLSAIGGLPERTPLDVRVTGVVRREGYRVEKVVFASQPGHFVTAHAFVPDGVTSANPAPAVLVSCGHAENGKLYRMYQRAAVLVARAGLIGLVFDPLEQGERWQGPKDSLCNPCNGHFRTGKRAHLLGWNAARFRIWDGMRAVDYLQSRPDVDGARIGVMGQSGGGTLSTYLFCLDDRIACAAPAGFITSMARLAEHWGPQDSEQVLQGQLVFGLNHLSMLAVRAPAPVCLTLVDQDAFVLDGALATAAKLKALYSRLGAPDDTAIVREPGIHGYYEGTMRGSVDWMRRHLKGETGPCDYGREDDFGLSGDPEGAVAPGGRVVDLPGSRTSYDLLRDELKRRDLARGGRPFTREDVLRLTGIDPDVETAPDDDCSVNFGRKAYYSRFHSPLAETAAVDVWLGTSFVKERAELFIVRAKAWCRRHPGLKMSLSVGADEAVAAAHARYLRPDLIGQVSFAVRPPSWRSLFEEDETDPPVESLVFGALPTYDWTDLLR